MLSIKENSAKIQCYHCGEYCKDSGIALNDKYFCCNGCKTVYEILQENQLCEFYNLKDDQISSVPDHSSQFAYLDLPEVKEKLFDFSDGKTAKATLYLPQIHCSACVFLLEKLFKINENITFSRIDFLKKQLSITFQEEKISLRQVVELLTQLGYEPYISLENFEEKTNSHASETNNNRKLIARMAVAGFCFGNIMMVSFPEYFGFDSHSNHTFRFLFNTLNITLSLPVFFYSGWGFIQDAWNGLKTHYLNTDFPLALGMVVLFIRSLIEIFLQTGPGYLDTMTGLVFFLLIGKWFQQKTYDNLRYDRDFKSYFPIAVAVKNEGNEIQKPISELKTGDRIIIRNHELIPADAILLKGEAHIDYSFVTGEAVPVPKILGEIIHAGGRQAGNAIELEVVKSVSQSYLTELWNHETFSKSSKPAIQTQFNQYFTVILLVIASLSAGYWMLNQEYGKALNAFTSVLIVACPCALVLGSSFALGTAMQALGKSGFYLKNTQVIEEITKIDTIIFDKTGTITRSDDSEVSFVQGNINVQEEEFGYIKSLANNSTHPLSRYVCKSLAGYPVDHIHNFHEYPGKGLEGEVNGHKIAVGSRKFIEGKTDEALGLVPKTTAMLVAVDNLYKGYFSFQNRYRDNLLQIIKSLEEKYDLHLLSGDNKGEILNLMAFFKNPNHLHFHQSPSDKLHFIQGLQLNSKKVMMLGDGLNDAGALQQSEVGIAVTENIAHFTPASDAILNAASLKYLNGFIILCKKSVKVIKASLAIAIIYNLTGLGFAVTGMLSPLVSAILMPVSSITVVLFTTLSVSYFSKYIKEEKEN